MKRKPDPRWEAFASREPYFAIFTNARYLRANLTAADEQEFFESGEDLVRSIMTTIDRLIDPIFTPVSLLEYGCGVGRLAIPFARRVPSVTAVDISPAMLTAARRNADREAVRNIDFRTAEELLASPRRFDVVNCYLVFQRLRRAEGLALLRQLLEFIGLGGIGVFHFANRAANAPLVEASRWLRERFGPINAVANALRGKPFGEPFIASHTYDLDEVLAVFEEARFEAAHVVFEHHQDISGAIIYVRRSHLQALARDGERPAETVAIGNDAHLPSEERLIDVRERIARTSIPDLNRTAEEYFSTLKNWEYHLAKPFGKAEETPPMLINVACMLQGLKVIPGATVLEFGAGTGWLSRFLTQLMCRVILLDVSTTALRIASELYQRMPVIGDRPAPQFVPFDGEHIDLPDESVDRILCFDAFHHAPNPDAVLREFGRVLRTGGIAAFAEPGPRHSRTPLSQFEMRTYGVIESDVDIHAIWRTAQTCGFTELKLAVFHAPAFHVTLMQYEDFLAGGETSVKWAIAGSEFLRDVRNFFLYKGGAERLDSRTASALACSIEAKLAGSPVAGQPLLIDATVINTGSAVWLASNEEIGGVALGSHLYDGAGKLLQFDVHWQRLTDPPRPIDPGEQVQVRVPLPPLPAGKYQIELDCVAARVTWFAQSGSKPAKLEVTIV